MYVDENRVDEIFQELCKQLEEVSDKTLENRDFRILEQRAEFHESEERRAKEHLPVILNELKQREVFRQINIKKTRSKANSDAYIKAKQGF